MKRILILFSLILIFGVIRGQSDYEKYGYPVFKKPYDTTNNWLKENISLTSVSPTVLTEQIFGGKDIQVFPSNTPQSEVHISLDVNNPSHLLISANTIYQQGWYFSDDYGGTWSGSDYLPYYANVAGDPSTAFDSNGNLFVSTITPGDDGYFLYKSLDQGQNWNVQRGDSTGYIFDKEMIACDNTLNSPYKDNLYCVWTEFNSNNSFRGVMFNRSTDGGSTFSQPIFLENGPGQGANVQTGPNGNVYVCWANFGTGNRPANGIGFTKSVDGGVSFSPYSIVFPYTGISYTNKGDTAFNNIRVNDFPSMAVDKSNGPYRGRIYIAYPAKENGNGKAIIQVRYSDDEGSTWSSPYTVSIPNGRQNFFPWIAVDDSTGTVCVVYYSFDSVSGWSTNTYMAYSKAATKWYNMRISDVSHITAPINNAIYNEGYEGDYIGIAAFGGKAYPAWMDNRNGTWQVYVSPVCFTQLPTITGDSTVCTSGSTFTLNNLPSGSTASWIHSSNLAYVSGQGTDNYTVEAANSTTSGMGWVKAIVSSSCGNDTIEKDVWVGTPATPTIIYPFNKVGTNSLIEVQAASPGADNYNWSIGGGTITSGQGTSDIWIMTSSRCLYDLTIRLTTSNSCGNSAQAIKSIPFDCSGGITPLSVSPNPASQTITVELKDTQTKKTPEIADKEFTVKLLDSYYMPVYQKKLKAKRFTINVSRYRAGIYYLQVIKGSKVYSKKVMIMH